MSVSLNKIILASNSPYRQALLAKVLDEFTCVTPDIDETPLPNETSYNLVKRLGQAKAEKIALQHPNATIIASDQIGEVNLADGVKHIQKPVTHTNAIKQLLMMSGKELSFYTSLVVIKNNGSNQQKKLIHVDITKLTFRQLTLTTIEKYLLLDKPYDCAGSFKVESAGIRLLRSIHTNDPNALTGLPLIKLCDFLSELDDIFTV